MLMPMKKVILPEVEFTGQQPGEEGIKRTTDTPAEAREWERLEKSALEVQDEEAKYKEEHK
jgi:hypothetical protein